MGQLFLSGDNPAVYSLVPDNGGAGLALFATTTPSVAVPLPLGHGRQYMISNDGPVSYWYGFGGPNFKATMGAFNGDIAYLEVLPGVQLAQTFPNDDSLTHISVVSRVGPTTGTISFGKGE